MKQNTRAGLHSDRLAVTEAFVIERSGPIHDFQGVVRRRPLADVLHADEVRLPLMRREKNFLIIVAWIALGLNIEETKLSRVKTAAQIFAGKDVGVIPPASARLRRERILPRGAWSNHRCSFFHGPVHFRWNVKAMPVDELGNVTVVADIDGDSLAFLHAQQRPRRAPVVTDRLNDLFRRHLDFDRTDTERNRRYVAR